MTITARKNLQTQYYIWKKSVLSNREGKSCSNISRAEEFYCVYYKDQLEPEYKPEDCVATKHSLSFLLFSFISEGSSFFKRSRLSWYKQQMHSILYATAIWFLTHKDALEALAESSMETASPTHTTWAVPQTPTHCGTASDGDLGDREQKCSAGSVTVHSELLVQVWGVPAEMKPVVNTCKLELGQQPSRERAAAHRLSQVSVSGQVHGVHRSQSAS